MNKKWGRYYGKQTTANRQTILGINSIDEKFFSEFFEKSTVRDWIETVTMPATGTHISLQALHARYVKDFPDNRPPTCHNFGTFLVNNNAGVITVKSNGITDDIYIHLVTIIKP